MDNSVASISNHHYALQVALQTMKARCIALQRRLTSVEEENKELRERVERNSTPKTIQNNAQTLDNMQLRIQVSELQRQMMQLTEHSNMVSNENRKLWSKLSEISKEENQNCLRDKTLTNDDVEDTDTNDSSRANQNLIRSKTFTQHSPNPNLRHKLISNKICDGAQEDALNIVRDLDAELNTISLDNVNLVDLGEQKSSAASTGAEDQMGFGYFNEDDVTVAGDNVYDGNFSDDFKKILEGLQEIRREAQQQQDELNATLTVLECNRECAKFAHKPEMADKSLETDDSLNEVNFNLTPGNRTAEQTGTANSLFTPRLNIIDDKIAADALDKTCPMCGKIFPQHLTFSEFQEHVEMHFVDDTSDLEQSIERNFEYISHTVGDF